MIFCHKCSSTQTLVSLPQQRGVKSSRVCDSCRNAHDRGVRESADRLSAEAFVAERLSATSRRSSNRDPSGTIQPISSSESRAELRWAYLTCVPTLFLPTLTGTPTFCAAGKTALSWCIVPIVRGTSQQWECRGTRRLDRFGKGLQTLAQQFPLLKPLRLGLTWNGLRALSGVPLPLSRAPKARFRTLRSGWRSARAPSVWS